MAPPSSERADWIGCRAPRTSGSRDPSPAATSNRRGASRRDRRPDAPERRGDRASAQARRRSAPVGGLHDPAGVRGVSPPLQRHERHVQRAAGANAASGPKHFGCSPSGSGSRVSVPSAPPSKETRSAQPNSGVSMRLATTRLRSLAGLRTSVGELFDRMSVARLPGIDRGVASDRAHRLRLIKGGRDDHRPEAHQQQRTGEDPPQRANRQPPHDPPMSL